MLFVTVNSHAAWIEASGTVNNIMTYSTTNTVLVNLSSNGASVDECSNSSTFAISKSASEEARERMFAMLLAAKTTGTKVTVAYNDVGGCEPWGASPNVYRTITRMR